MAGDIWNIPAKRRTQSRKTKSQLADRNSHKRLEETQTIRNHYRKHIRTQHRLQIQKQEICSTPNNRSKERHILNQYNTNTTQETTQITPDSNKTDKRPALIQHDKSTQDNINIEGPTTTPSAKMSDKTMSTPTAKTNQTIQHQLTNNNCYHTNARKCTAEQKRERKKARERNT